MNAADSCSHGIEDRVLGTTEFSNAEVAGAFVKPKADVDAGYFSFERGLMESGKSNGSMRGSIERKVGADESECLTSPDSRIRNRRNSIESYRFFEASLCVFRKRASR